MNKALYEYAKNFADEDERDDMMWFAKHICDEDDEVQESFISPM